MRRRENHDIASAKPKGRGGGGGCSCICLAPSGINGGTLVSTQTYNSQGYSCSAFENATCNIDNPYTGGIATGSLMGCMKAASSTSATIYVPLFGVGAAKVVAQSARFQRRLPPNLNNPK
jgi:hypothetical protein